MSLLDQQLKELQVKKFKILYFQQILELLTLSPSNLVGSEQVEKPAQEEAIKELTDFITTRISSIENGEPEKELKPFPQGGFYTKPQLDMLLELANRALERTKPLQPPKNDNSTFGSDEEEFVSAKQVNSKKKPVRSGHDVLAFAMQYRHLDQKTCSVTTKNGEVAGKIVGTEAPFLVVQTETGHTIKVPPESVIVG